jgi:hypothetical protein
MTHVNHNHPSPIRLGVGALLLLLGVGGFVANHLYHEHRLSKMKRFRKVRAKMLSSHLMQKRDEGYHLMVKFRYTVNGKQYTSRRFEHADESDNTDSPEQWQDRAEKYAKGKTVWAYYDPRNPQDGVLLLRVSAVFYWGWFVVTILLALAGSGLLVHYIYRRKKIAQR